jgi:hypothetical protein
LSSDKEALRNRILWLTVIAEAIHEATIKPVWDITAYKEDKNKLQADAREWLLYDIEFYDVCDMAGLTRSQALSLREKMEKRLA